VMGKILKTAITPGLLLIGAGILRVQMQENARA
jgi:hypothetical protein